MKSTAAIAGRRQSRAKDVSIAAFFLQDPKYDLELHHKRWPRRLYGAILFKVAFDKSLLSDQKHPDERTGGALVKTQSRERRSID